MNKKIKENMLKFISIISITCFMTTNGKLFIGDCAYGFCNQICKAIDEDVIECFCRKGFVIQRDGRNCVLDQDDNQVIDSVQISGDGESLENCDDSDGICDSSISNVGSGENNDVLETFEPLKLNLNSILDSKHAKVNRPEIVKSNISSSIMPFVSEKVTKFSNTNLHLNSLQKKITPNISMFRQSTKDSKSAEIFKTLQQPNASFEITSFESQYIFSIPIKILSPHTSLSQNKNSLFDFPLSKLQTEKPFTNENSFKNSKFHAIFSKNETILEIQASLTKTQTPSFEVLATDSQATSSKIQATLSKIVTIEKPQSTTLNKMFFFKNSSNKNIDNTLVSKETQPVSNLKNIEIILFSSYMEANATTFTEKTPVSYQTNSNLTIFKTQINIKASIPAVMKKTLVSCKENLSIACIPNIILGDITNIIEMATPVQSTKKLKTEYLHNPNNERQNASIILKKTPILFQENLFTKMPSNSNYKEAEENATFIKKTPVLLLEHSSIENSFHLFYAKSSVLFSDDRKTPVPYQGNTKGEFFYNSSLKEFKKTFSQIISNLKLENAFNASSAETSITTVKGKIIPSYKKNSKIISFYNSNNIVEKLIFKKTPVVHPNSLRIESSSRSSYTNKTTLMAEKQVQYQIKSKINELNKSIVLDLNYKQTVPVSFLTKGSMASSCYKNIAIKTTKLDTASDNDDKSHSALVSSVQQKHETSLTVKVTKKLSATRFSSKYLKPLVSLNTSLSSTSLYFATTHNVIISATHKHIKENNNENVDPRIPKTSILNISNTFTSSSISIHQSWVKLAFYISNTLLIYFLAM